MATQFDFASLGNMFGGIPGATPTGLDALLTEDQRKLLGRNAALSAAGALLQASGRSAVPISMGQALGSALQAGQQGYQQARAGSLQDLLLGGKLKEMQTAQNLQKQVAGILTKPPTALSPEMQALAAPGMQVGPTMARADLAASIPQPSAGEFKAGQYQQIADIYAAQGKSEDAKRFQEMAEKLNPRAEITGQPFEVTDAKGNPLLVQQYKDGTVKTMQGYGPKRDVVLQSLGGQTVAINKSALKGGETFVQTMTPGEIANLKVSQGNLAVAQGGLNLRQKEFDRNAFDVKEGPDGFYYVPKAPGGAAVPVMGAAGQQLMPGKEAPQAFSEAAKKLNNLKGNISAYRTEIESNKTVFPSEVPLPFGARIPLPTGSDTARLRGKYQSLLMGVKDLYELGALTGPDMGIISEQLTNPASFSGMFTSRDAMKEQIKILEDMSLRAEENLSSTYKRKLPAASTAGIQPAPAAPAAQPMMSGVPTWDPVKKQYVYQ
jgi:hypothetical protein